MSIIHIKSDKEYTDITSTGLVVIDFSATWCGPCIRIAPSFKELAKQNKNIKFVHIDVDEASEHMPNQLAGVRSVPTFRFYKNGKLIETQNGANLTSLKQNIEKLKEKEPEEPPQAPKAASKPDTPTTSKAATNEVVHVRKGQDFKNFLKNKKLIVDYSAKWCMPCKIVAPIFAQLAAKYEGIKFIKVDIDETDSELEEIVSEINSVPNFHFYLNGKLVDELIGANPLFLKQKIEKLDANQEPEKAASVEPSVSKIEEEQEQSKKEPKVELPDSDEEDTGEKKKQEPEESIKEIKEEEIEVDKEEEIQIEEKDLSGDQHEETKNDRPENVQVAMPESDNEEREEKIDEEKKEEEPEKAEEKIEEKQENEGKSEGKKIDEEKQEDKMEEDNLDEEKKSENEAKPTTSPNGEQTEKLEIDEGDQNKSIKQEAKNDDLEASIESEKEEKSEQEQKKKKIEEKNEEAN